MFFHNTLLDNSLQWVKQSLCDDNIQTTKFVTCQDRISQNYPFADFSSSAQTAAFFLAKGHYTLLLSLSGIVSDSMSTVREFLSSLLKNRCLLVNQIQGVLNLHNSLATRFFNSTVKFGSLMFQYYITPVATHYSAYTVVLMWF